MMVLVLLLQAWNPATDVRGPFSHEKHIARGVDARVCTNCHGVGSDWRATVAGRNNHLPCQNEACHAPLFRTRNVQICFVCHQSNEPFKGNDLRHVGAISREWKMAATPHAPHLARGVQCQTCHRAVFGGPAALEDGHKACGECHEAKARPGMDSCKSCHAWYTEKHEVVAVRPWSTGARFKHDQRHFIQCDFCHRSPATAADLTPPTMEECARCHDKGQPAAKLKVTGFGCAKCHGGARS